jgi:hypothetical protein
MKELSPFAPPSPSPPSTSAAVAASLDPSALDAMLTQGCIGADVRDQ